jgi:hypothetical protein
VILAITQTFLHGENLAVLSCVALSHWMLLSYASEFSLYSCKETTSKYVYILNVQNFYFQESMVTIECVIPQKHHRTVMGAKGVKVQGITSEFDVQIKFPDRDARGTDHRCMVMVIETVQTKHMGTFCKAVCFWLVYRKFPA